MSDRASAVRLVATSSSTSVLPRLRCRPRRPIPCLEEGTTSYSSSAKSSSYSSASSRPSTYFMSSSSSAASSAASAASSSSSPAASSAASADSSQLAPVTLLRFDPPNGPCGARNREKETFFSRQFFFSFERRGGRLAPLLPPLGRPCDPPAPSQALHDHLQTTVRDWD